MSNIEILYCIDSTKTFDLAAYIFSSKAGACVNRSVSAFNFKFAAVNESIVP